MKTKSILVIQDYVPEYRRTFFEKLYSSLKTQNVTLTLELSRRVVLLDERKDSASLSFGAALVPAVWLKLGRANLRIRRISLHAISSDLVVLEQAAKNIDSWFILAIRKVLRKPTVVWGHGPDFVNGKQKMGSLARRIMLSMADHVFLYTNGGYDALMAQGVKIREATILQNSTDTMELRKSLLEVGQFEIDRFMRSNSITEPAILYLGALDPSKNLDLLIEAVGLVVRDIPQLSLLIVGDGPLREKIIEHAASESWIKYLGRSERIKILSLSVSDALVLAGRVGLVSTDAFGAGLPVVTVESDQHAPEFDYLESNETCIIANPNSVDFAQAIKECLEPRKNLYMRSKSKAQADFYTTDQMVQNFVDGVLIAVGNRTKP